MKKYWVWEHEWNCIPPASDFIVIDADTQEEIATFSKFDWGWRNAEYMAHAYKEMLEKIK